MSNGVRTTRGRGVQRGTRGGLRHSHGAHGKRTLDPHGVRRAADLRSGRDRAHSKRCAGAGDKLFAMSIIGMLVVLVIVGVLLWLLNTMVPMDQKIKTIIN